MTAYSRLAYGRFQRALRLHSPLRDESHKREIVFPYIAKAAVDDLLALIESDTLY